MSRVPKPPIGFVPVDSEEAKEIPDEYAVNVAYIGTANAWNHNYFSMEYVRDLAKEYHDRHYHVQLPPPVEWEKVWGWEEYGNVIGWCLTKNGKPHEGVTKDQLDTIVRALNEMEVKNG